jgi:hypothetical protein
MFPRNPRLARRTGAAFDHFKLHPRYARSQVELRTASKALKDRFPSSPLPDTDEAQECAVAMFTIHADAYLGMVDDLAYESSFEIVVLHFANQALEQFSGGWPSSMVQAVRPEVFARIRDLMEDKKLAAFQRIADQGDDEDTDEGSEAEGIPTRRGYRAEVRAWMQHHEVPSVREAAKRLAVGYDILKNIMSDQGDVRYSEVTLKDVLTKITAPNGEW